MLKHYEKMLNNDIFTRCSEINDKLNEGCVSEARAMVIKLLDCLEKDNDSYATHQSFG